MRPAEQLPDVTLMIRVRDGDETAFETLHERYQRKVLNFFYGMCGNAVTASDLCQETFLRIWKIRKRYTATGLFVGYLFAVARLVWREHRRHEHIRLKGIWEGDVFQVSDAVADPRPEPDDSAGCAEMDRAIAWALGRLPEEQRMAFILHHVQGLSLQEVAQAMDCPVNTVRSRRVLAIHKLRVSLADLFGSFTGRAVRERK